MKELVAKEIAKRVVDGDVIGVGTGTTVDAALIEIGKRVKQEGLSISVVPSSYQSAWRCQELGFHVLYTAYDDRVSWGFDGADQVTRERWAIKGKGGAMLQEKLLAKRCNAFIIIVDESKVVDTLGSGCPVPVEVLPEGLALARDGLRALGALELRVRDGSAQSSAGKHIAGKHGPVITEKGNLIVDALFPSVHKELEREIKSLTGVVESGLFIGYTSEVVVAGSSGVFSL